MTPAGAELRPGSRCAPFAVEEDDRGDIFYAPGHVEPRLFVRAVISYLVEYDRIGDVIAVFRRSGRRGAVIAGVRHVWRRPGSGWVWCPPGEAGAQPWTTAAVSGQGGERREAHVDA